MALYYRNINLLVSLLSNTSIHLFRLLTQDKLTLGFDIQLAAIFKNIILKIDHH